LSLIASINHFFKTFKVGSTLKKSNAYKKRGILVKDIVMYLISLAYMGKIMHRDVCSKEPVVRNSSSAVYRFLRNASINWSRFLFIVGGDIACEMDKLTDKDKRNALI
jgi:hypothetical protein